MKDRSSAASADDDVPRCSAMRRCDVCGREYHRDHFWSTRPVENSSWRISVRPRRRRAPHSRSHDTVPNTFGATHSASSRGRVLLGVESSRHQTRNSARFAALLESIGRIETRLMLVRTIRPSIVRDALDRCSQDFLVVKLVVRTRDLQTAKIGTITISC